MLEIGETERSLCKSRGCDKWTEEVRGRLETCINLRAEDAVYHRKCYTSFYAGIKHCDDLLTSGAGRRKDEVKLASFNVIWNWFESQTD